MPTLPTTIDALMADAASADAAGELTRAQLAALHGAGWFRMLAPRDVGGLELPLPEVVRLEETLAEADGSCGWVTTLCAGAGWFAGFMPPARAREILATPDVCLAGSGAPTGFADRDGDGWVIRGQWRHASGSQLATHFTFNAQLRDGGLPVLDTEGRPRLRAFVVPAAQVQVDRDSWHSIGLRASTSRAFSVDGVHVDADQAFDLDPACATAHGPLYRFPFEPFAWVTLAACVVGMARRFVALAEPLATRSFGHLGGPSDQAQSTWRDGHTALDTAHTAMHTELATAWRQVERGDVLPPDAAHRLGEVSHAAVRTARHTVDTVYTVCGLLAADPRAAINRVWRDFHTATQHAVWVR